MHFPFAHAVVFVAIYLPHSFAKLDVAEAGPVSAYWPFQSYQTVTFNPPVLDITTSGAPLAPGYLFFGQGTSNDTATDHGGVRETAPLIMTDAGELVWSGPRGSFANNLKVNTLNGTSILSYWSGIELAGINIGHYYGAIHLLDSTYQQIDKICPKLDIIAPTSVTQDCLLDGHESYLTGNNTIIFTAYNITSADLTSINGSADAYIWDGVFYEMDLTTRKIIFEWSAKDHVPIVETRNPLGASGPFANPFDYFHINSVTPVDDKFLVNARHTWSTYLINRQGEVEWTLQGQTGGDFSAPPANGTFRWQHHALVQNVTSTGLTISYFDNHNAFQGNGSGPSKGMLLHLDTVKNTTTLVSSYHDPADEIYSDAQGSFSLIGNSGSWIAYYGLTPTAKEFGPDGDTRWTASFGPTFGAKTSNGTGPFWIQSYRMYKQEWHATPVADPKLVVKWKQGLGYVSWNGATEVQSWKVYSGSSSESLVAGATVAKNGKFEVQLPVDKTASCVQVAAYNGETFLRNSSVVCKS